MMNFNMEHLFFSATEEEDAVIIEQLLSALKKQSDLSSDEVVSGIDFLLEAWGDSIENSSVKANFCLELALLSPPDSATFRIALHRAFNCLKKSTFMKSAIVKATGVRDDEIPIKKIAERFLILEGLKSGILIFNPESGRLGKIEELDEITSEISAKWHTANSATAMSLQSALSDLLFLTKLPAISIASKKIKTSASDWKKKLKASFMLEVDDAVIKQLTFSIVIENGISSEVFVNWWKNDTESVNEELERHPSTARTLHELNTLLLDYSGSAFSDEEQEILNKTFHKLKLNTNPENMLMLAESLAMLKNYIPEEGLVQISDGVKDQVIFWPHPPEAAGSKLAAWEKLSAKYLSTIAQLTADIFSDEYMASLLLQLTYRCWNSISPVINIKTLSCAIENAPRLTSDIIFWVWKNRNKLPDTTVAIITPQALRKAIDAETPSPSVQDVKNLFIDDKVFQKELIKRITGNEMDLLRAIQACNNKRMDEKQSLLVKCSAISSAVKHHIEKGEGKKMFAAAGRQHIEKQSEDAADITSFRSFAQMMNMLNDIINKQIPDNSAAIAHARSYGDLRENAEYKAAKERQAYLQNRRDEIEASVVRTQPIDFSFQEIDKTVMPGSTVTIAYSEKNEKEAFHVLGVWDSDPETNCIAYTSALGKVLNDQILNDEVVMPDKRKAVILKIEPLSKELLDKLNAE